MAATPMMHLRGGHAGPHTQPPKDSTAQNNPRSATITAGQEDHASAPHRTKMTRGTRGTGRGTR